MSTAGKARRAWGNENWRAENHFKHMTSAIAQVRPAVELEVVEVCASAEGPAWGREGFADRDKEVTMKEKTLGTKLLLAAVTLGVLAYFSIQAVRYFGDPLTTTIAYQYQVEMSTVLSGYVVRDEAILTDDTSGLLQLQRAEGERISDGGVVALVYADQATLDRQKEIQSLHTQIEQLQYAEEAALGAEVSLRLDAQILQTIRDYRGALAADRLDTAEDCGAELRSLVMKRDYTYSDTEDLSAQMAELQSQLSSLRAQAGSSVRQITAPQAGLYSAVVDGYENILTPESLETLTPRTLAALEPDESLRSNRVGKLVLGDTWYGLNQTAMAAGSLAGGLTAGLLGPRLTVRRSWLTLLACGVCLIPMGLCLLAGVGAVAAFAVLTAAGFVLMACAALFTVTMLAHIQAQTPATLVGKVVSLLLTVSLCAQPAGQALYGVLLEQLAGGEGWVLLGAACGAMIVAAAARRVAYSAASGSSRCMAETS